MLCKGPGLVYVLNAECGGPGMSYVLHALLSVCICAGCAQVSSQLRASVVPAAPGDARAQTENPDQEGAIEAFAV